MRGHRSASTILTIGAIGWLPLMQGSAVAASGVTQQHLAVAGVQSVPNVGQSEADTTVGPDLAVNPLDVNHAVAVYQMGRYDANVGFVSNVGAGSVANGVASTTDGGATWHHHTLPGLTSASGGSYDRADEPSVAFGYRGYAYAESLLFSADACDSAIVVQRSRDVGATWTSPVAVSSFTDDCNRVFGKPRIVTDTFAGSLHQGRVYVLWDDAIIDPSQSDSTTGGLVSDRQTVSFSDDSGRTWSAPAHLSPPTSLDQVITFARPVVQSDGAVTDVYSSWDFSQDPNNPDQHVFAQTSHNGGSTWTPRVDVSGAVQGFGFPDIIDGGPGVAATTWDPVKHKMYAVWTDSRYRSPGENDILMSTSTNGLVWSSPRRVNVDKVTSDTNHTTPDVAADNGKVFVSYRTRDHESSGNTRLINFVLASSFDGGSTFAVRAIGPQSDITYAATTDGGFAYPGHYSGSAAANGRLYTAWAVSGARGAQTTHQSVYAATFTT